MYNKNTRKYNGNRQYGNKPKQTRNYYNDSQEFPASNSERKLKTISFNDFIPAQKQAETKPTEQKPIEPMQTEQKPAKQTEQNETKYFNILPKSFLIDYAGKPVYAYAPANKHYLQLSAPVSIDSNHLNYFINKLFISNNFDEILKISDEVSLLFKRFWNVPIDYKEPATNFKLFEEINNTKKSAGYPMISKQNTIKFNLNPSDSYVIKNIELYKLNRAFFPFVDLSNANFGSKSEAAETSGKVIKSIADEKFAKLLDLYKVLLIYNDKQTDTANEEKLQYEIKNIKSLVRWNKITKEEEQKRLKDAHDKYAKKEQQDDEKNYKNILKILFFIFHYSKYTDIFHYLVICIVNLRLTSCFAKLSQTFANITLMDKEDFAYYNEEFDGFDEDDYNAHLSKLEKIATKNEEQKQFINLRKEIIKNIRDFKLNLYDVCEYDTKYRNIMITFIISNYFHKLKQNMQSLVITQSTTLQDKIAREQRKTEIKLMLNRFRITETNPYGINEELLNKLLTMPANEVISTIFERCDQALFAITFYNFLNLLCETQQNRETVYNTWKTLDYSNPITVQNLYKWCFTNNDERYIKLLTEIDNNFKNSKNIKHYAILYYPDSLLSDQFFQNMQKYVKEGKTQKDIKMMTKIISDEIDDEYTRTKNIIYQKFKWTLEDLNNYIGYM